MRHQLFSNRRLLSLAIILVVSNLLITGVSMVLIYHKSISSLETTLIDIVERQKSLVTTLHKQGKNEIEIIQFIKTMRGKHYGIGKTGEFVIAHQSEGYVNFLLAHNKKSKFNLNNIEGFGIPMRLALQGNTGFIMGHDYSGVRVYAAYTYFSDFKWGIVAKIPTSEVNQPYFEALFITLFVSILLISFCVFLFVKLSNPIVKSIIDSEKHYRNLFENNHVIMLVINPSTLKIIDANPAACKYYGYEHSMMVSMNFTEINVLPPVDLKQTLNKAQAGKQNHLIFKHKLSNGVIRDVEVSSGFIRLKGQELLYSVVFDIYERLQSESKLKESEETYRMLFESINDAVFISEITDTRKSGKFIKVNDIACERLGYTREELFTMTLMEINSEKSKPIVARLVQELFEKKHAIIETDHVTKDGRIIPVEISTMVTQFKNKTIFHSIARDITKRKRAEEALRLSEERLKLTLDATQIAIWDWDIKNDTWYASPIFYTILGYEPPFCLGDRDIWIERTHPGDREEVSEKINFVLHGHSNEYQYEARMKHANGSYLWQSVIGHVIEWDNENKPIRLIGVQIDITDRKLNEIQIEEKRNEIEAQNEEYRQINDELFVSREHAQESDRLKSSFLANMSHEIRTPMNAIMGFSELLPEQYNNKPKLEEYSKIVQQRCGDLLDIINEILDIAKIESGQLPIHFEECSLNSLFSELSLFFNENQERLGKGDVRLIVQAHYPAEGSVIITDKVKLKQIFINLISNAFKFTVDGEIQVGCKLNNKNNLVFYVSDTGIGIPLNKQDKIFERFTQLDHGKNRLYGGTGLGLSIVKGLVNLLGGEIWLESEPDKGSTFYFTISFKISNTHIQEPIVIEKNIDYDFSNKTILIVEDDVYNAEYLKEVLKKTRLNIMHTLYGHEAIEISLSNSLDMILMDIGLPDMNGYETTRQIKKHKPDLKIIAQTAYATPEDKQKAINAGCIDYISKPLNPHSLLSMINKHMDKV